ncbi:MAG: IspD/TarI family cytidylyltransferase [Mobilitalea sp.]
MNIAVIFAGGVGTRMNSKALPKQFLEIYGKPIIVYTLEIFQYCEEIDAIIIACHKDWINYLQQLVHKFRIEKVVGITVGGETGQESIYNGLAMAEEKYPDKDAIVLIHDGVRPLINAQVIKDNIESVKKNGSAITTCNAKETFTIVDETGKVVQIPERAVSRIAKAPQSFYLADILQIHRRAQEDGIRDSIDSCTLMNYYGRTLTTVEGPYENIKVTTQDDFFIFRALYEAKENAQLFGF